MHSRGPFTSYPSSTFIQDFFGHLNTTGRPDTWVHHTRSQPPRDAAFEIIKPFDVPEALRGSVPMASCPICSPDKPKYFSGALVWFPEEGCLRAIGGNCATGHFGHLKMRAAQQRYQWRRARDQAQNDLFEILPILPALIARQERLAVAVGGLDQMRRCFATHTTKVARDDIRRQGATGTLYVYTTRWVEAVGRDGRARREQVAEVAASHSIRGIDFLRDVSPLGPRLEAAIRQIKAYPHDDDGILAAMEVWGEEGCIGEAETLRKALALVAEVEAEVRTAQAFFQPENLAALDAWLSAPGVSAKLCLNYNVGWRDQFYVGKARPLRSSYSIPPELMAYPAP